LLPISILGDPQWACNYAPIGWNPLATEWAWRDKPGEGLDLKLKYQKKAVVASRLLIGTCVARLIPLYYCHLILLSYGI
jgi:hypothetical protein